MTLIIAEAGVNHNGDLNLAHELVDAAYEAGVDLVKFQTFKAEKIVTKNAPKAKYQKQTTSKDESQYEMLSKLELTKDMHYKLVSQCNALGIEFLSTAFDEDSLDFLVNDLGLKRLKIPSGEITNAPLVLKHAKTKCNLIVSTGMSNLSEIESMLGVLAFGFIDDVSKSPSKEEFAKAYSSVEGQNLLKDKVTLLHCTSEYPTPINEINLKAINTLQSAFKLPVGYSDHSDGLIVPLAAVARGAEIIEKHFTLDKSMPGPDHQSSLEPFELKEMVDVIKRVEIALGDGVKRPTMSEVKNKSIARKSIVAESGIVKGEIFTKENISIKRPGNGISPDKYWITIGNIAKKDYQAGDLIDV